MTHHIRSKTLTAIACAVATTCFAASAQASLIHIISDSANSTEGLGSFEGTIEYQADISSSNQGLLTISLINTTPSSIGGFITGFVFNIDSADSQASASLIDATHSFDGLTDHMAPPFGMSYDAGAALGGNWSGGGNPNPGIAVGNTGAFTFDIVASDADLLTAASFLSGPYDNNFVVRFRGMADGSDKVPGTPINSIPAPGAIAILIAAGLISTQRRRPPFSSR